MLSALASSRASSHVKPSRCSSARLGRDELEALGRDVVGTKGRLKGTGVVEYESMGLTV